MVAASNSNQVAGPGQPSGTLAAHVVEKPLFMFSLDLEDIRSLIPYGDKYTDRLTPNTERVLEFLHRHRKHATFFATGDVARRHPELIRRIVEAGHEIGCHTSEHIPLDRHSPDSFRSDVERCLDDFARAGAETCIGFRAPIASLVERTRWAYEILKELGFEYSSSVLAAANPLYGWPEFGRDLPKQVDGLWEIPTSLSNFPRFNIPYGGGVYFRVLPASLVRWLCNRRRRAGYPTFSYMHPYDIDDEQERFMHPEIHDSEIYNYLLFMNRRKVLPRIEKLIQAGYDIMRYDDFVKRYLEGQRGEER